MATIAPDRVRKSTWRASLRARLYQAIHAFTCLLSAWSQISASEFRTPLTSLGGGLCSNIYLETSLETRNSQRVDSMFPCGFPGLTPHTNISKDRRRNGQSLTTVTWWKESVGTYRWTD